MGYPANSNQGLGLRYTGQPTPAYGEIFSNWGSPSVPPYVPADYSMPIPSYNAGNGMQPAPVGPIASVYNTGLGTPGTAPAPAAPGGFLQDMRDVGFLGSTDKNGLYQQGWGGMALGAVQGLGGLYLGMQQYNLAKDALANSKAQFERNYAAQKAMTNANLEDRQRARVASNAGAYQSVGDYMSKNGIK